MPSGAQHQHQHQHHHHHQQQQQVSARRPFTLNEALPYTPITSVFPFEPDIINTPTIGSGPLAPSIAGLVSREDYDALNNEARYPNQSKRLEGSLEYVQTLLKPEKITRFQFKTAPKATNPSNDSSQKSLTEGLSPFARMVYDNTAISFRYPTPETPRPQTVNGQKMSPHITKGSPKARKQEPPKVVKHNPAALNAQAVAKNKSQIEIHLPSQRQLSASASPHSTFGLVRQDLPETPSRPAHIPQVKPQTISPADLMVAQPKTQLLPPAPDRSSSQRIAGVTDQLPPRAQSQEASQAISEPSRASSQGLKAAGIRIELPVASFNKDDFVVVDDALSAPYHLSTKKRKRAQMGDGDDLDSGLDNRERANAALRELQRCLQEIFEAEDKTSGQHSNSNALITIDNDQEPTMTTAAHSRALKLILRTLELGCFRLVPAEDILRVQNLCDGALKQAANLEIKIDDSWGEVEVGMWLQQLPNIEAGLKAARTALTVMSGGREERQLYSEDLIQQGLNIFKNVIDGIIVPLSELRGSDPSKKELFRHLTAQKKAISTIFTACQKLFTLMSTLITSIDLSETVVSTLEFASSCLIFVENAPEKDSVVGTQKFDGLRLVAMDMLSQIFLMNPSQRQGIFDDILTSLEKLPLNKLSARQFKLSDGGSIQPVSALIMRLVQASAGKVDDRKEKSRGQMLKSLEGDDQDGQGNAPNGGKGSAETSYAVKTEDYAAMQPSTAIQELEALAPPLFDTAKRNAAYVVNFMVKRAQKSTKSGDTPYRNLLDLFVEDFTTCLDSPDWPAAELLLRLLMFMMLELVKGEKNAAPAKNMALELLGVMAAAISKLRSHVRKTASNFEGTDADELGRWLAELTTMVLDRKFSPDKIINWLGPYRVVLEYLEGRVTDDPHLRSAISYFVTDWAVSVCAAYDDDQEESEGRDAEYGRTAYRLRNMVEDRRWLTNEYSFKSVVASHAKLSHSILLLRSQFCDYFKGILNILMQSMTTDAATVRSRSLKSINQVLETDPTILDGDSVVIHLILQCSNDSSPQVRDSALGLIGKCIAMRPLLEEKMTQTVIQRFTDAGVGVRKRAMKLARDIYLGNQSKDVRSAIANGLLHRMQDPDEGVRELARQMIEEVWISPFYKANDSMAYKQSLTDHVVLMVQTVKQGNASLILDKVFQTMLAPESKLSEANSDVCKRLVANMFDLVDNPDSEDLSVPTGKDALQVLMIFAKADPRLFTFEQIRLLKPRIASVASVSTSEEFQVSRAVVVIYRRVLPQVSSVHNQFLAEVRRDLMPALPKVTRALLDDVMACLWIISGLLETSEHLARLVSSSLAGVQKIRAMTVKGPLDNDTTRKFARYSLIVGMAGKHCNLDQHAELFKSSFPKWQGNSVSKLMVDVLVPFANPSQPAEVRKAALDAIGLVCQANPRNYVAANVYTTFQQVFDEQDAALESMILRSFKEFLFTEEKRSEQAAASANGTKEPVKKDLKSMGSTGFDDVASATTQRFLKEITRITTATQDEHAFLAMEVLATISRQGLVHPKETGVTLITLETCPIMKISELAYQEHRALHEKHETVIEREYVKAVQAAFQYQRDITGDSHGATENPFTPKLHLLMEVLKISKSKNRQRFQEKLIGQIDFEPAKLEVGHEGMPHHVEYSRFLVENLAFFEYVTVSEVQATITAMEKLVTSTGSGIAQSIESEIFQVRVDTMLGASQATNRELPPLAPVEAPVNNQKLRQLSAGSIILLVVWEARTYLRRAYGLNANRRESKGKGTNKDLTRAPIKVQGVTGDKFWEDVAVAMTGLDSHERMVDTCKAFVELLNVDKEFQIAEDDDDVDGNGEPTTPDPDDDDEEALNSNPRGRKRKAGHAAGGKLKRARSNSKPPPRGRSRKNPVAAEADSDAADDFF
ncbi:uncharacterized protein BCR38DRAFT_341937 [Pseudomassariella vexata]|uniref:Sister chromatid cohesion protein n=1 Tax=Pseudomassariella vexata TaxID=1141098 RepID=A0A1Y2E1E8_9PEZI|nr:uncharacterized protein BCR38DRAFT_341937 [Pseudomassariella vexata]ORY65368.1 hypothetical protein BCR38DRAFT_341937 [Pseudomassariella vexata]